MELGRYAEARKALKDLMASDFENEYLFHLLAHCEISANNWQAAQAAVDRCLEINADNDSGHYRQSLIDAHFEKWTDAEDAIERAISLEPQDPDYFAQLARIQLAAGKTREAGESVREGLTLDPNHVDLLGLRTSFHFRSFTNDEGDASLREALRNDPQNSGLLTTHGYRLLDYGKHREAGEAFASALALNPNHEEARQGLAETFKVRWWIFRIFYKYGFSRWTFRFTWWSIIIYLLAFKTMVIWGGFFALFLLFTWWGDVLFNSMLRLGRQSRYLLSESKIKQSNYFLLANGVTLLAGLAAYFTDVEALWKVTILLFLTVFTGIAWLEVDLKRQRQTVAIAGAFIPVVLCFCMNFELGGYFLVALFLLVVFGGLFSLRVIGW